MLYLYAIAADSPAATSGCTGLRGATVEAIGEAGLFAAVSRHDDLRLEASAADLWAHERVVEQLMDQAAVLPMRFASTIASESVAVATLRERRGEFQSMLSRVRGAVELAIRATFNNEPAPAAAAEPTGGPGTTYMLTRLGRTRQQAQVAARIHQPLSAIARESDVRVTGAEETSSESRPLLTGSYLVDRDRVAPFRARVAELDEEVAEAKIACTGPWPPYSFTSPPPRS